MASVYKRNGSKNWQASFLVPDPNGGPPVQIRRSTGKRNEREAKIAAAELEKQALAEAGLTDERCRRIMAIVTRAAEDATRMTLNAAKGRSYIAELVKIATGDDVPEFSIRSWTEEWQKRKFPRVSESTRKRYRCNTNAFVVWLGERADRPLESITVTNIREFQQHLSDEGRSDRTCQFYLADVGSVFRDAVREGILLHNPVAAVAAKTDEPEVKRKPFTDKEVARLLKHAPTREWRGLILLGAFAGIRLGDAATLDWSNVDLGNGTLTLIPSKTARKQRVVTIPMHPEVRKFLSEKKEPGTNSGAIFADAAGKGIGGRSGLSKAFAEIMQRAKVPANPDGSNAAGEGSKHRHRVSQRSFHSLRHTFTSWLANAGVSPELRMKLTGHTTADIHAGYTHHELATLADAVTKLPKIGG